ncbi:hypothetical protein [Kineococcus rhizosphaerae]|uniref:Uncharacterized protein n=1 Tax=Kineococcus rhizosphaerae TaxID=559628 RepID=A0A2T0R6A7_9ACTN|nr:hypothetical protein [Kineococcus rhizosphaerae]PRY16714.1 hypothetical protein CLV37_103145 [Kineococcus rhizosphaerae]
MTEAPEASWGEVLPHRDPYDPTLPEVAHRLGRLTSPPVVADVLADHGDGLLRQLAGLPVPRDWVRDCGGLLGAVLVLAEVDVAASALRSQLAAARARALADLVQDHSLVDLARELGVTRQALHKTLKNRGL